MDVCVYVCVNVCMCVCACIWMCMDVYECVCANVCTWVYVHMCFRNAIVLHWGDNFGRWFSQTEAWTQDIRVGDTVLYSRATSQHSIGSWFLLLASFTVSLFICQIEFSKKKNREYRSLGSYSLTMGSRVSFFSFFAERVKWNKI